VTAIFACNIARLRADCSGLAIVEFALVSPVILGMFLVGAELTNFTITKMRISQIALHVADNGSRIGAESLLTNPQVTETQINDLFVGAGLQAGTLALQTRGKVILSSLEPVANPNTTNKFKIRWQRCYGTKVWTSSYGVQGATNLVGMGPAGRQVTAPDNGGVMYVEIAYDYKPLISAGLIPNSVIKEVAAMTVRDDRDYSGNGGTGVYNSEGATVATC
jgi:Flp pilus assembly protein TadG